MTAKIKAFFANYIATMMEENSDNLKRFEVRPGIYTNVDPARLMNIGSPHYDIIVD